jgi:hypothetical protein
MGTPWMGFVQDEFGWKRNKSAWSFGLITLIMGLPTVLFFQYGVFDEYDYWAGTVSLVVFALLETVLFAWIFGMKRGWSEITEGADIRVPMIYRFIIKYITPLLLAFVFFGALVTPEGNNWIDAFSSLFSGNGWPLDNGSIIKQITNAGLKEKILAATDPLEKEKLQTQLGYVNFARVMLVALFLFISAMVYRAYQNRMKGVTKS